MGAAVQYSLLLTHSPQLTHSVDPPSKSEKLLGLQPFDLRRDDDPGVILICFSNFPDFPKSKTHVLKLQKLNSKITFCKFEL